MKKASVLKEFLFLSIFLAGVSTGFAEEKPKPAPSLSPYLGDKLPPYNNVNRFLFETSFIYWKADVDGIDFALRDDLVVQNSSSASSVTTTNISYSGVLRNKDLVFEWEPGFKVGVGVLFGDRDEWDLILNWTWLQPRAHKSINGTPADFSSITTPGSQNFGFDYQIPGFSGALLGSPAVYSKVHWRMLYNTVDFELGRHFFLAKNLTMRPHIGLRGAILNQTTSSHYELNSIDLGYTPFEVLVSPDSSPINQGTVTGSSHFKGKNNYDSLGLRGGFDLRWNFTNHFCAYGSLAGSILYGRFKVREYFTASYTNTLVGVGASVTNTTGDVVFKDGHHRTRTNLQAIVGAMWHTDFNHDKQHLSLSVGYEVNEWFQQNELRSIDGSIPFTLKSNGTNGDIGLHGFNFDVAVDF